ncbi:MAG: hypothetical protein GYA42_07385 [Syntrophomonadaceae bacterium]|nr:hypothetical protein [Syntrophomonadaceae bacterium]
MPKIPFYLARILSVSIVVFFAFFLAPATLPAFGDKFSLILALIVLAITISAWYIPMLGGLLFVLFGVRYFIMIARPGELTPALLLLTVFLLTGGLFMWEGYRTKRGNKPIDRRLWFP